MQVLLEWIVVHFAEVLASLTLLSKKNVALERVLDHQFVALTTDLRDRHGLDLGVVADLLDLTRDGLAKRIASKTRVAGSRETVWNRVLEILADGRLVPIHDLEALRHRGRDGPVLDRVLDTMVGQGLVMQTGRGRTAKFQLVDHDIEPVSLEVLDDLVWLTLFRVSGATEDTVLKALEKHRLPADFDIGASLDRLIRAERVERSTTGRYWCRECNLPEPAADEVPAAALKDHFRSIAAAVRQKIEKRSNSGLSYPVGGSTFNFDLAEGHPLTDEVTGLLDRYRNELDELLQRVDAIPLSTSFTRVSFYFGQAVSRHEQPERSEAVELVE